MKTAISIPDAVFDAADGAARRLGMSRSALYAKAVAEFLAAQEGGDVTVALDRVYQTETPAAIDPALGAMQARSLPREEW